MGWWLVLAPATLGVRKREEPGKTGRHPVFKYRVPHGSHHANSFVIGTVEGCLTPDEPDLAKIENI